MLKAMSLLALKMTDLVEAEGRLAKSEIHQLAKAFTLYLVSGMISILAILAMAAGLYNLMQQVMPPGVAMLVGAMILLTIAAGFASYAQKFS
ncbi:MAG: hypothetical protein ACF8OB_19720 [Phycisphaeraceae bacterium JB051]